MSYLITEECIGCGICKNTCPVDAIDGHKKEVHIINKKRCVDCGACGKVCPKESIIDNLGNKVKKIKKEEILKPIFDEKNCTACGICVDICGKYAIDISRSKHKYDFNLHAFLSDEKACVGCEMCKNACPISAIKMGDVK